MNLQGLTIGLASFLTIGAFHPLVIKGEFYFGVKIWKGFLAGGVVFSLLSLLVSSMLLSSLFGVVAFSSFWSILEVFHQHRRVERGWFPVGPGHWKESIGGE